MRSLCLSVYDDMILAMSRVCGEYLPSDFRVVTGSRVRVPRGGGTGGPGVHRPGPGQGRHPMASVMVCEGIPSITCRMRFALKTTRSRFGLPADPLLPCPGCTGMMASHTAAISIFVTSDELQ